ncbi:sigma-70 family RNA polymerase sigma factor [Sorangium sp. So ce429]
MCDSRSPRSAGCSASSRRSPGRRTRFAIARDDLRRAFDALNALPVKERVAFSMYYLDGKEQEEIGRVLGHSKGYVCKLIQRAVRHLGGAGWKVDHGDV